MVDEYKQILELLLSGKNNNEIALVLNYSKSTVKRRIKELFARYKVKSRIELATEYQAELLE